MGCGEDLIIGENVVTTMLPMWLSINDTLIKKILRGSWNYGKWVDERGLRGVAGCWHCGKLMVIADFSFILLDGHFPPQMEHSSSILFILVATSSSPVQTAETQPTTLQGPRTLQPTDSPLYSCPTGNFFFFSWLPGSIQILIIIVTLLRAHILE